MELRVEVANVPQCNSFVVGTSGEDVLAKGVERHAVDLRRMSIDRVLGLVSRGRPGIPDEKFVVVSHRPKNVFVMPMPGHILNNVLVSFEGSLRFQHLIGLCRLSDVPDTDVVVVGTTQKMTFQVGVPREAIAFFLVSNESDVWLALSVRCWLRGMLCVVEHKHIRGRSLRCNDTRVLRHVSGSVYFARMVDFLCNLELGLHSAKTTRFSLVVVLANLCLPGGKRELHLGYHQVVLLAIRRMCAQNHAVLRVVLASRLTLVR
mmetsp:Transcript_50284/g.109304  ORF Transcript_50284/g.109304 Transcript_50284/m.109304 type:complete len:262 (+) Transcript_50284:391-1176(+)